MLKSRKALCFPDRPMLNNGDNFTKTMSQQKFNQPGSSITNGNWWQLGDFEKILHTRTSNTSGNRVIQLRLNQKGDASCAVKKHCFYVPCWVQYLSWKMVKVSWRLCFECFFSYDQAFAQHSEKRSLLGLQGLSILVFHVYVSWLETGRCTW